MKISTRGRYAVMAMVELARQSEYDMSLPVKLVSISQAQDISLQYLEKIFADLRQFGLVESVRGKNGGYLLSLAPDALFLSQIIDAVDEPVDVTRCKSGAGCSIKAGRCMTHDLWSQLSSHIRGFFDAVSLQDVLRGDVRTMFMDEASSIENDKLEARVL
ncbi:RrF2 family transcriptional regulator [Alphaproteobacteria bacterium]|nr:RrF2 family transcriptional regulator [Alphaproteobacteria bacterium]